MCWIFGPGDGRILYATKKEIIKIVIDHDKDQF